MIRASNITWLLALAVFGVLLASIVTSETSTISPYVIAGDSVFVNDSKVYLSATPHTSRGEPVVIDFQSKVFTGDISVAFGFPGEDFRPVGVERFNPRNVTTTQSYTCEHSFDYTMTPEKRAWCFIDYPENGSVNVLFNRTFETGDLATKTVSWSETEQVDWSDTTFDTQKIDFEFGGVDTWRVATGLPIVQDEDYKIKVDIDAFNVSADSAKYWVCVMPSSYGRDIRSAYDAGHLYCLDPWVEEGGSDYHYWYDNDFPDEVWVKLNLTAGTNLTLTIDNTSGYAKDFDSIFLCGDDFDRADNAVVGNGWTEAVAAAWSINGSRLQHVYSTASNTQITKSCDNTQQDYVWEFAVNQTDQSAAATKIYQDIYMANNERFTVVAHAENSDTDFLSSAGWQTIYTGNVANQIINVLMKWNESQTKAVYVDVEGSTFTNKAPYINTDTANYLRIQGTESVNTAGTVFMYYEFLRKFYATEPTVTCENNVCVIAPSQNYTNMQVKLSVGNLTGNYNIQEYSDISFQVTLNAPANNSYTHDQTPDFNFTANGTGADYDCDIVINSTNSGTNATTLNNTVTTITVNRTLDIGNYEAYITCTNGTTETTGTYDFEVRGYTMKGVIQYSNLTVVDGTAKNNTIIITDMDTNETYAATTTNSTGGWTASVAVGDYSVSAWTEEESDGGGVKPHINVPLTAGWFT